jgi:DNA modification methylase
MKGSERDQKRCHPTQKPVVLCVELLSYYGADAVVILDCYLGSGTTMIACEQLERKCYGIEIDPNYCDVVVKRWEEFTGHKAKKLKRV